MYFILVPVDSGEPAVVEDDDVSLERQRVMAVNPSLPNPIDLITLRDVTKNYGDFLAVNRCVKILNLSFTVCLITVSFLLS